MTNTHDPDKLDIHIMHDGKFYFSIFEGRHPAWCDLKILQGKAKTLVILSQPHGYIGTSIPVAIRQLTTQILNTNGLDPAKTIFLQYTPPTVPPPIELDEDDIVYPLARITNYVFGPSDGKYELITLKWISNSIDEPMLIRYYVQDDPYWEPIIPGKAAKLLEALNKENDKSEGE